MKLVTKRSGQWYYVAFKDKNNKYHCIVDGSHSSDSIIGAGHLYTKTEIESIKKALKENNND